MSSTLAAATQVFLSLIAYSEGTGDRYDLTYNHHVFRDFDRHPNIVIRGSPYYSSAAGRYQFIWHTFTEMQKKCSGIPDFTPASQDNAAVCLLDSRKVNHTEFHTTKGALLIEIKKIANVWASLPGSPYGQPTHSMDKLWKFYNARRLQRGK